MSTDSTRGAVHTPFLPLLLLAIAFVGWMAIQTAWLVGERQSLIDGSAQQGKQLEAAYKMRLATDSLASKMQALANKGNANAQVIVAQLKQRGISINPGAPTPLPP